MHLGDTQALADLILREVPVIAEVTGQPMRRLLDPGHA
jgi:hypothetical protein